MIVDDEKREVMIAFIGLRDDATADFIDVFGDERIFDHLAAAPNIAHDHAPDL